MAGAKRQRRGRRAPGGARAGGPAGGSAAEPAALAAGLSRGGVIAAYHRKQKELAAAERGTFVNAAARVARVRLLRAQLAVIGLGAYQAASRAGEGAAAGFDSSVWVLSELRARARAVAGAGGAGGAGDAGDAAPALRLLDVGAIVHRFPRDALAPHGPALDATAIDLRPADAAGRVLRADFFAFAAARARSGAAPYDVVCLCLCVNFVGCARARGRMLLLAARVAARAGLLFLTLPRACVDNSRFLDAASLAAMLAAVGWETVSRRNSDRLVLLVCRRADAGAPPDDALPEMPKRVVRGGDGFNNFAIELAPPPENARAAGKPKKRRDAKVPGRKLPASAPAGGIKKPTTSNQRKRARQKAMRQKGKRKSSVDKA